MPRYGFRFYINYILYLINYILYLIKILNSIKVEENEPPTFRYSRVPKIDPRSPVSPLGSPPRLTPLESFDLSTINDLLNRIHFLEDTVAKMHQQQSILVKEIKSLRRRQGGSRSRKARLDTAKVLFIEIK